MAYPPLFDPKYIGQARKVAALGATDEQIADIFGVSARTFYRWKADIPQMADAVRVGKALAEATQPAVTE